MSTVDQFILLRHAHAGKRIPVRSRDFERGLVAAGRDAAIQLPELITRFLRPSAILSSPFRRCVETVEPLATALDLDVVKDGRFTSEARARVRAGFAAVPANAVVCTHGEVIARLLAGEKKCAKGAFWVVERSDRGCTPVAYVEPVVSNKRSSAPRRSLR